MITLRGTIESGQGNFGVWISKLSAHYERKTGIKLYPGTLNVRLVEPYAIPSRCIRLEAGEYGGSVNVNILPCRFLGRQAFILRTDANENGTGEYPRTILEIASDVKLRDKYNLSDGDKVSIDIDD